MSIAIWINPTLAELSDGRTDWTLDGGAASVRAAVETAFGDHPRLLRGLIDETGALRPHIAVFADGKRLAAAEALDTEVADETELAILTAVSGG